MHVSPSGVIDEKLSLYVGDLCIGITLKSDVA